MAKVLLVTCYSDAEKCDEQGIASIAYFLRKNMHEVKMLSISKDSELDIDSDYMPDVVGISTYHDGLNIAFRVAEFYKKINSNTIISFGGYSATYYYSEILKKCKFVDVIICGEGEVTFNALCDSIDHNTPYCDILGLVYRNDFNEVIVNQERPPIENLDRFVPETSKDILISNKMKIGQISSSRGCMSNCSFCYSYKFFDPSSKTKWRAKSAEVTVNEIKNSYNSYGINKFYFNDCSFEDSFEGNKRMWQICEQLIKENLPISFTVSFRSTIYKRLDDDLIEAFKSAGLNGVFLGVEAFNNDDLILYNKHTTVYDNEFALDYFKNHNINPNFGFINFNPYSNIETLTQNAELLNKHSYIGSFIFSHVLRAYRGTSIYDKIKDDGLLTHSDLDYYAYKYVNTSVGLFENFLTKFFNKVNDENNDLIKKINYFYMYYPEIIAHYRVISQRLGLNTEEFLMDFEKKYQCIIAAQNKVTYLWYHELLELLKNKWNPDEAKYITDKSSLVSESLKNLSDFKNISMNLNKKLVKYNKNFFQYIHN